MTYQAFASFTNEYTSNGGLLIIENIIKEDRKKTDVIREILEDVACPSGEDLIQSTPRYTADCGSQAKEA